MDYHGIDIKLVNVKTFVGHDTKTGLNADIVYNGVKILHIYDSAHGGCFEYTRLGDRDESIRLEAELQKELDKLPEVKSDIGNHTWKHNLDWVVDVLFTRQEDEKAEQKNKMYNKGILYKEDGHEYNSSWKGYTLTKLAKHPKGLPIIQAAYMKLSIKKGVEIINLERLKKIGVKI